MEAERLHLPIVGIKYQDKISDTHNLSFVEVSNIKTFTYIHIFVKRNCSQRTYFQIKLSYGEH